MAKPFASLTRSGQTRRLRRLALQAVESSWKLRPASFRQLSDSFNAVFRLGLSDGRRYAVRVHRGDYRQQAAIDAELRWLAAIAADGIDWTPRPVPTPEGALQVLASDEGVPQARVVSMLSWIPGRPVGPRPSAAIVHRYGAMLASLHRHGATLPSAQLAGLPRADRLLTVTADSVLGCRELGRATEACEAHFARWRACGRPLQPIHGDPHLWNIHRGRGGRLWLLDFDDAVLSWPAYDLGIARFYLEYQLQNHAPQLDAEALWDRFREGYAGLGGWPLDEGDLNLFVVARQLELVNTVVASGDPWLQAQAADYLDKAAGRVQRWLDTSG